MTLDAVSAWRVVRVAITHLPPGRLPEFADPRIREAVRVCGWNRLCANPSAMRRRFIRVYQRTTEDQP